MKKHEILSLQSRTALFDPPTDARAIVRHYTFSLDDMALIRQRRRAANRLGFAVNLAYLRLPGRVLGIEEIPPADMLAYIAKQITCEPASFDVYAQRGETRREHLGELQAYLDVRSFQRDDKRAIAHVAVEQAVGSDRGDVIVSAMIEYLRERRILLPAAVTLENIALAARALARKRAYKSLGEIRDRTFENQRYRASGLNLAVAAIILWNTVYLGHAVGELRSCGEILPDELLAHVAPLGWEHIAFNGDYVWPAEPIATAFRPLRNPRAEFLDGP